MSDRYSSPAQDEIIWYTCRKNIFAGNAEASQPKMEYSYLLDHTYSKTESNVACECCVPTYVATRDPSSGKFILRELTEPFNFQSENVTKIFFDELPKGHSDFVCQCRQRHQNRE